MTEKTQKTEPRRPRRLVRRLFTGQMLVILIGAVTLGAVAFLIAPPIFDDHVRRAVGPVSEVVAGHLDAALSETLAIALTVGIVAAALAAAAVAWLLARRIAAPVEQLSDTAEALAAGQLGARAARPTIDEDLGLVSRAEEGRLPLDLARIDLGEAAERALESFTPVAQVRGITLEMKAPSTLPPITGDRDRLGQVLTNLLDNAIEHTPDGGRITITMTPTISEVTVAVDDTGLGIAPEHLPHLFQRFYRADPARRHTAGSGIGLTISRAIVRGHGSELTAHSDGPGRGATLTFRLPIAGASDGSGPEAASASGGPGSVRSSRRGSVGTS